MTVLWKKMTAAVPAPFAAALLLGAGMMGFVAWDQSHWWSKREDYSFGWLAPLFVAFIVHDRWPKIIAALGACGGSESPRAGGWRGGLLVAAAWCALLGGALLFLSGAIYRAGNGHEPPATVALTAGMAAMFPALLLLAAPDQAAPGPAGSLTGDGRVRLVSLFLFPTLVWLVSSPMGSKIETALSVFLLGKVTTVVFFFFDMLGFAVQRDGNVLKLPEIIPGQPNEVGVAEACSGIRSLTACLFAGSFLSAVFLDRLWKKILLVVMAAVFAFGMNIVRAGFLTSWAYQKGADKIVEVHDLAGYAVLGVTVAGLLALLPILNLKIKFGSGSRVRTAKS